MLNNITLGQYYPAESVVHRLDPRVKIILLIAFVAAVFLVPLTEEALYRGLLFHKLYEKKPIWAYIVSMLGFAAIHVMGYIGTQPPLVLFLCFLQYLPAGYCLCWCYRRTGTILCPVLMHTIVNASSILYYLR